MEEQNIIYHKIEAGKKIRVFKNVFDDKTYYRVQIQQKNYDGTKTPFYIGLQFKKGVNLENETDIIIKKAFENFRENPKDKYNGIKYYVVSEFEIIENKEKSEEHAFKEFNETIDENEIDEADLPF